MNKKYFLKKEVILLPSCIHPLVKKNVSNLDANKNLKDLNQNIKNLFKKIKNINKKFDIIISDCSQNFQLSKEDIYAIEEFSNVHIINIKFNIQELKEIQLRGKGYCEILMIKHTINQLNLTDDCNIHKLTARYSLVFPEFLLKYHSDLMKNNDIVILFSYLFRRTSCHFFTIKKGYLSIIIDYILEELNDNKGNILEKVLFFFIKNNNLFENKAKRSKIYSYYRSTLMPGSTLARYGSSSYFYQVLRNIAFLI